MVTPSGVTSLTAVQPLNCGKSAAVKGQVPLAGLTAWLVDGLVVEGQAVFHLQRGEERWAGFIQWMLCS